MSFKNSIQDMQIKTLEEFKAFIRLIVQKANELKNKHVEEKDVPVNYACIFSQNSKDYASYLELAQKMGKIVKETKSGPLFQITPLITTAGNLQLLKIRLPDPTRTELGDADFTLSNYEDFKKQNITKNGYTLIKRKHMEMIELMEDSADVRVYFSHPPLDQQLGIVKN